MSLGLPGNKTADDERWERVRRLSRACVYSSGEKHLPPVRCVCAVDTTETSGGLGICLLVVVPELSLHGIAAARLASCHALDFTWLCSFT